MRSHRSRIGVLALSLGLSSLALACGGDGTTPSGVCSASGTGTLVVNVVGLPAGVTAKVSVTGPSGTQAVSASQTFAGAAGGSYSITADKVTQADPIVRTVYSATISASTVCVSGSATQTVTVTYAPIPTSNKVWLSASNSPTGNTHGFASALLGATGNREATVATKSGAGRHLAFDRDGNLWSNGGTTADPALLRIPAASFAASGAVQPDRKIDITGLDCIPGVGGIAFDKDGSLWFGAPCKKVIYKLAAAQLAASATVTPVLTIPFAMGAEGLAFDKSGNLWVGSGDEGHLARFDAASLASAAATPSLVLTASTKASGGSPLHPGWLAFDASGNLWTNDFGGNVVFQFPAAELAGTAPKEVVPPALVTVGVSALLGGMSFDEGGGLWVTFGQGKFARLAPPQLTVTTDPGNPTLPERVISSANLGYGEDIALYPAPASLPLYTALP